jgi:NAD-dependent SIR2 family protein deacetylase
MPKPSSSIRWTLILLLGGALAAAAFYFLKHGEGEPQALYEDTPHIELLHGTTIRKPSGPAGVSTGLIDLHGHPVLASCGTCHATRPANGELKIGMELKTFHQGLKGGHGSLTCISCHNAADGYQTLRLADGRGLPFSEVMQLCAQCHGPQFRDYQHGAHGGMTGHWDLSKGGRMRNNCIDCHDPHSPKYPIVRPAAPPNDRFLNPSPGKPGAGHE